MKKQRRELPEEEIEKIIAFCRTIKERGLDPFSIDVQEKLEVLRELLPKLKDVEQLVKDAEALKELADVIGLQEEWVRLRTSRMFIDPSLVEAKLKKMDSRKLADLFLRCWRPLACLDQLTVKRLREAYEYWKVIPPLEERLRILLPEQREAAVLQEELVKTHLMGEAFERELNKLKEELESKGKCDYWEFVKGRSFEETLNRAYLVSFLVSRGEATLSIDPLEEKIFIEPLKAGKGEPKSIAISISYEDWVKRLEQ